MPEIAVAILNWNGRQLLERFLPGVLRLSPEARLYVIDNASEDDSRSWLAQNYPEVVCLHLEENRGYAGGYNRGLKLIPEELVVLLNSDVRVSEGWLQALLHRFHTDTQLAALQPKILDEKKAEYFEYAGAAGGFIDRWGYPFCRGRIFDALERDKGQYDQYREVFWATGACLVVRKSAYWAVGGLDEHLFAHMEEIDLCWRLQNHGHRVACEPASVVYHLGGATLQHAAPHKTFLNFRNNLCILFLNLPTTEALPVILARLFLDGLAGLQFLLQGRFPHFWAVIRAHFAFYGDLSRLSRQKLGRPTQAWGLLKGVYPGFLVGEYFLRQRRRFRDLPHF